MFSIVLGEYKNMASQIIFWGYDIEAVNRSGNIWKSAEDSKRKDKTSDGIFWMQINSKHYWRVKLYNAKIGEITLKTDANIIFNSGTSYI